METRKCIRGCKRQLHKQFFVFTSLQSEFLFYKSKSTFKKLLCQVFLLNESKLFVKILTDVFKAVKGYSHSPETNKKNIYFLMVALKNIVNSINKSIVTTCVTIPATWIFSH